MFDLTGRTALVTGASGGIGRAIAVALHAQGAKVGLSGTRADALEALAEMGAWPGPRDPVSERGVQRVRDQWAALKREFRNGDRRRRP